MDHLHYNETSNDESEYNVQSSVAIRLLVAAQSFNQVYTPLLCLFGALGNLLSVTVFCRTPTHRSLSASFYLSALAISDTGFLFNLLAVWLEDMGLHVITAPLVCPTVMYMGQVTCFLSVWFIVAFTMERFFAVCYPLTRPTVCTVARAKKVIIVLTLTALIGFSYVCVIARVLSYPAERSNLVTNPITTSTLNYYEVNLSENFTLGNLYNTSMPGNQNFSTLSPSSTSDLTLEDLRKSSSSSTSTGNFIMNMTSNITIEYISICSVRQEHVYFSSIASHIDSVLTLILPFGIIAYLNVRISLCVWKLKDQRENLVAMAKVSSQNNGHGRGRGTHVGFVYRASKRHVTSCATTGSGTGNGNGSDIATGNMSTNANSNSNINSTCSPNMNMNSLHPNSNLNLNRGFSSRDLSLTSPGANQNQCQTNHNHNHLHVNSASSSPIMGDNVSNHSYTRTSRTNLTVDFDTSESVSTTSTSAHCCTDFPISSSRRSKNRKRSNSQSNNNMNMNMRRTRKRRLNGSSHAKAEARVTKTLLLVSTVFLVLNTPSHAIRAFTFVQSFWEIKVGNEALFACQLWANILFNANFAVNFLLYCVSGRNFRVSLVSLFCSGNKLSRYPKSKRNHHDRSPSAYPSPSAKSRDSFYPVSVTEVETYA